MISIQSLNDNLLPNVYVKRVTLDSQMTSAVAKAPKGGAGYYDPNSPSYQTVTPSNYSTSRLVLSMKFLEDDSFRNDLMELLMAELSDDINIYIHQVTSQQGYELLTKPSNRSELLGKASENHPSITTKVINFKNIPSFMRVFDSDPTTDDIRPDVYRFPEQYLDDGRKLAEAIADLSFDFPNDTDFLGYVIVVGAMNDDLRVPLDEPLIGKVSGEIVIMQGVLQTEALAFVIAPYSSNQNISALSQFGKPGDIWCGGVHMHKNRFMAGDVHGPKPHPYLDYRIVPNRRFVDNRVGNKVSKKVINITKTLEKLTSITSRYRNSSVNLLDFESYKKTPPITEIFLSQDKEWNINGFFGVDKKNLVKNSSAMPFLLENAAKVAPDTLEQMLRAAELKLLTIHEDNKLLGTLEGNKNSNVIYNEDDPPAGLAALPSTAQAQATQAFQAKDANTRQVPYFYVSRKDITYATNGEGIESYCFKKKNHSLTEKTYKIKVSYSDPTVSYAQGVLTTVKAAFQDMQKFVTWLQKSRANSFGKTTSAIDPGTEQIKDWAISQIKAGGQAPVSFRAYFLGTGNTVLVPRGVFNLLGPESSFFLYFYSPDISRKEMINYICNLCNINTTTISSLLVLESFLKNAVNQIESDLRSVGKGGISGGGTGSDNQYGTAKGKGNVYSSKPPAVIEAEKQAKIKVEDHGYDFTAFMQRNTQKFPAINKNNYRAGCLQVLYQLVPEGNKNPGTLSMGFKPKGLNTQLVSDSVYSYLSLPIANLKSCVLLPPTVMSNQVLASNSMATITLENLFMTILKFKKLLWDNKSKGTSTAISERQIYRENLDLLLAQSHAASLPEVAMIKDVSKTPPAKTSSKKKKDSGWGTGVGGINPVPQPFKTGGSGEIDIYSSPASSFNYEATYSKQQNQNFLLASIANKFALGGSHRWICPMGTANFTPFPPQPQTLQGFAPINTENQSTESTAAGPWFGVALGNITYKSLNKHTTDAAQFVQVHSGRFPPLQVTSLSLDTGMGPTLEIFKDFTTGNQIYINNNVINPLLLCYYWFIHQNIVKVEYLNGYEITTDDVSVLNPDDPYGEGNIQQVQTRNVGDAKWSILTADVLNKPGASRLLCKITRYEYPHYIDKHLLKELNLPLINNYFILEGETADFTTIPPLILGEGLI